MDYTITPPKEGAVTIVLDWKDAEILTRLVGTANHGNLSSHSPALVVLMEKLNEAFGRNIEGEANRFVAEVERNKQVYITDLRDIED
jgi:hypothetical protein